MASSAGQNAKNYSKEPPLRILCFGNSLTRGHPVEHPYAIRMRQVIEQAFPGRKVEYEVDGMPGDLVTVGSFISRIERNCKCPPQPSRQESE